MNDLVPFGKYKGQPVEQLRNDPDYVEWLIAQPWFAQKFGSIKTLIVNNFKEPNETPEHNRLQAKFLDSEFAARVAICAFGSKWGSKILNWQEVVDNQKRRYPEIYKSKDGTIGDWFDERRCWVEFETKSGWDVEVRFRYSISFEWHTQRRLNVLEPFQEVKERVNCDHEWHDIPGELKPTLGDEYPRVLREVKCRTGNGFVYAERFVAQGATLEQAKTIFGRSGIPLITEADLNEF